MKTRLEKAVEYIIGYCNKHIRCSDDCKLYDADDGYCIFLKSNSPVDWNLWKKGEEEHNGE